MIRRGAILLELLVALAILVLAASVLLSTVGDVQASIDRDQIAARAADLARTRMSEIEAGLAVVEDLRSTAASSDAVASGDSRGAAVAEEFTVDATVSRSAFEGLSLVELRVFHAGKSTPAFVLRQLVSIPRGGSSAEEMP